MGVARPLVGLVEASPIVVQGRLVRGIAPPATVPDVTIARRAAIGRNDPTDSVSIDHSVASSRRGRIAADGRIAGSALETARVALERRVATRHPEIGSRESAPGESEVVAMIARLPRSGIPTAPVRCAIVTTTR